MMNAYGANSRRPVQMSEAAAQALDELLEERREEVLAVAREASSNEVLTAADVVRAYHSSEERQTFPTASRSLISHRVSLWPIVVAALAGVASLVSGALSIQGKAGGASSAVPTTAIIFSSIGIAVFSAIFFLAFYIGRRNVDRAERAAEARRRQSLRTSTSEGDPDMIVINDIDVMNFLYQWSRVEERLQKLANSVRSREKLPQSAAPLPLGKVIGILRSDGAIDNGFESDLREALSVRNMVAHGETVSARTLQEGFATLDRIQDRLDIPRGSAARARK